MPKGKKKRGEANYCSYIHKIMKQIHPDLSSSRGAVDMTNWLTEFLLFNMTRQSVKVAGVAKKSTLSARHVQSSCRLCIPGDLASHAISEGTKAVSKFVSA